jgi:uncharacterized protein YjbJ (UPF0337 family)
MLLLFLRVLKTQISGVHLGVSIAWLQTRDEAKSFRFACDTKIATTNTGGHMNWDLIEGKWKQMEGRFREQWGNLTDDDLEMITGKRDQLIGRLQVRYGIAKEEAAKQVDEFADSLQPKDKELKRAAHQS